jgi:hypothetical protein
VCPSGCTHNILPRHFSMISQKSPLESESEADGLQLGRRTPTRKTVKSTPRPDRKAAGPDERTFVGETCGSTRGTRSYSLPPGKPHRRGKRTVKSIPRPDRKAADPDEGTSVGETCGSTGGTRSYSLPPDVRDQKI